MNRKSNIVEVADKVSDISKGQIFLEMVGKSELALIKNTNHVRGTIKCFICIF